MFRVSSSHLQEVIVVHKQHMVPSLSIRVLVSCWYAAIGSSPYSCVSTDHQDSYREWRYHMLLMYNYVLLKMSTWYSKHAEESNNIWRINNIHCITLVVLYGQRILYFTFVYYISHKKGRCDQPSTVANSRSTATYITRFTTTVIKHTNSIRYRPYAEISSHPVSEETTHLLWNTKVHDCVIKGSLPASALNQISPVYTLLICCVCIIIFDVILTIHRR